ncbi:sulfotransferase family protein [Sulfurimonas sp. HSL-3221]|uniref:sulfotransferase family 2 domain-containing protein n=1 Tax=Thiomicrolovo sulfuroxydans TaxID=2894755 RepID=UPI001E59CAE1|nr:sulfotransferase family 2 domain-containing protein [Sulfurimonas sp. HSL-3221]UFS62266.1 sulfotransferase family protein [Sulfurimonas sp. HSL-3221]
MFVEILKKLYEYGSHPLFFLAPKKSIFIFHHLPKCGGTSVNAALRNWFIIIKDYREGWTDKYPEKKNLENFRESYCLSGHFEVDNNFIHQRYPEVFTSDRYKVFTFVRDPLALQLSLYRYEKKYDQTYDVGIEEYLDNHTNYFSNLFPATYENYQEIIDRYYFVGILEKSQLSLNILAQLLHKPPIKMKHKNTTAKTNTLANQYQGIDQKLIAKFKEKNKLDYLIYDYCIYKFNEKYNEYLKKEKIV